MATIISPDDLPTATLALPSVATASASRRLPPPCWTPDETVALIDSYKDKWYTLRRGNLRANHWQEVAEDVASRCPANPPKTAVQCRHKMEKLRKRYRAEIQRSAAQGGARRSASSWAHFQNMHSMEKGTNSPNPPSSSSSDEEEEESKNNSLKRINDLYNHHSNHNGVFLNQNPEPAHNGSTPGVRIKIPGGLTTAKVYRNPSPNPRFTSNSIGGDGDPNKGKRGRERAEGGVGEVVGAIQALGEGFMRMEKAKMEMAREMEEMRMEMELKRTEMILESQQRIVEAFAHAIKKPKKNLDVAHLR